jgi:hypothetical protein
MVSASTKLRQIFYVQIEQPTFHTERDEGVTARRSEAVKFPTIIHAIFEMAPRSGAR